MHYYKAEFKIECDEDLKQVARELLADMAGEAGFESFEETEQGLDGYVQMDLFHKEMLDQVISEFPIENTLIEYTIACVIDEDWNQEWESIGFEPIDINEQIMVFDAKKSIPLVDRPISIGIEAKNAFGTGTHETTQMILSELLEQEVASKRVLDCGCGTGILGIAASKLGAEEIVAYDIDEWSVKNTDHNAVLNGVSNIRVMEGDSSVLTHISGVFDLVMANINRNILLADLPRFREVLNVGGTIILSGFYTEDAPMILEKAWELGLSEFSRKENNNWCMLVLK
ncbi:MAG: 50S ribosomal protein L11 methyltransferase [Prevotellaceae bacterium]|nr:50S ribosomal protein L11 methyltransferase [Prevotellaceae bacterium]